MNAKRSPSWDDLKIFLELSRHSTIHAASKKLNIDHTTVCRRLARIETALGLKLVDRSKAGLVVRPEAIELLRHIQYMEWHAHALSQGANTSNDGLKLVRIATMEGLASGYIAQRIPLLKKSYPAIKVELVSTPTMVDVSKREADIFISFFEHRHRGLRCQKVGEVTLYLYASSAYERRNGLPKSENELRDHDYVGYIDDLLAIDAVRWLKDLVPSPRIVFHSNSVLAQRGAAISGMGIAMLPTFVAADSKGLKPIRPDRFFVKRGVWMSVAGDPDYTSPIRAVAKFLVRIFEEDKALLLTP